MLASLLATIEQGLGPSLSSAGDIAFLIGLLMLAYVILAPVIGIVVEMQAARIRMQREWTMHCVSCRRITVVDGTQCSQCGQKLGIPWAVRLQHYFGHGGEPHWLRTTRWIYTLVGIGGFALITVTALGVTGAWSPQTNIEKLFVGLSLLTWAGLGWLLGRVLGIGTGGPIARVRDAVFSLALFALLLITTALATAARPVEETIIAQVRVEGQVAHLGTKATALAGYQLGFEYLYVEHAFAGFRHVTPLAIVGTQRIELPLTEPERDVAAFLWKHANGLGARGLAVRKRTDQFAVAESGTYEIVLRGHEISIRQYAPSS
jgi:hypothetical protein